jgi:hypothetical protein
VINDFFPAPKNEALAEMEPWQKIQLNASASKEDAMQSWNVWMLDNMWDHARCAINAY